MISIYKKKSYIYIYIYIYKNGVYKKIYTARLRKHENPHIYIYIYIERACDCMCTLREVLKNSKHFGLY